MINMAMTENKTPVSLNSIIGGTDKRLHDSLVINERLENIRLEKYDFQHSIFEGVGIKNKKFKLRPDESPDIHNCDFSHCIFRGCYFRESLINPTGRSIS